MTIIASIMGALLMVSGFGLICFIINKAKELILIPLIVSGVVTIITFHLFGIGVWQSVLIAWAIGLGCGTTILLFGVIK